jgi:hypothetical protein
MLAGLPWPAPLTDTAEILPKGATGGYIDTDGVGLSSRCGASPLVSCNLHWEMKMSDLIKRLKDAVLPIQAVWPLRLEAANRIEELEGQVSVGIETLVEDRKRIAELEAQNRIFRSTESVDDSVWNALLEQVRQLQFQLAAAEAKYDQLCADLSGQTDRAVQAEYKHTALIESLKGLADEMRSQSNKSTDCYTDLRGFADHMSAICTRR